MQEEGDQGLRNMETVDARGLVPMVIGIPPRGGVEDAEGVPQVKPAGNLIEDPGSSPLRAAARLPTGCCRGPRGGVEGVLLRLRAAHGMRQRLREGRGHGGPQRAVRGPRSGGSPPINAGIHSEIEIPPYHPTGVPLLL